MAERYFSASAYYQQTFGRPVQKAVLDIGCTCPNIDGTIGTGGCIFCDGGSGHFTHSGTVTQQLAQERQRIQQHIPEAGIIAYFQAHTNTYGDLHYLESCYLEALQQPDVVGIAIGTRPDCLSEEILSVLENISAKTHLTVELGLQTIHEKTARFFSQRVFFCGFSKGVCRTAGEKDSNLCAFNQRAAVRNRCRYVGNSPWDWQITP